MQRKKILHLIGGLEVGGAETQLLRVLPELQKYHSNRVCCVNGYGPIGSQLEKNGVPVDYLNFRGASDIGAIFRFYKVIKNFYPDILTTYLIHADLYGRVLGKLFGIEKIVCSKRGALLQWEWLSFFDRLTKYMVTHYLVQTETAKKEWMEKLKLSENKFTVIPNGIDTKKFNLRIDRVTKKESLGLAENSFVISCVSRLRRGKGHEILLQAFENTFKENKNVVLLIAGNGEREAELKKLTGNYNSKAAIFFLGNRNDVPELLAISNLFVLPTEKEGMSNAIIEAMAAGVPIISTDIPENMDLLENNETGILFPAGNANLLTNDIDLLHSSQTLRMKLGQNALQRARENFDIGKIVFKFAKFYEYV